MSLGDIFEFAPKQIAVLFEEVDVPVARIGQDHRRTVFLCQFLRFPHQIRTQALPPERLLHKQRVDIAIYTLVHVRDHARQKPAVFIRQFLVKTDILVFRLVGLAVCIEAFLMASASLSLPGKTLNLAPLLFDGTYSGVSLSRYLTNE